MKTALQDMPLRNKESGTTAKGHERASAILDTARLMLARDGYAALSMRSIAAQVGVSLSTVQHYFPSREVLIEALLIQTFDRYQAAIDERVEFMGEKFTPALFQAVIDYFLEDLRDPVATGLFFEVSALANRHTNALHIFDTMLTRARKTFRNLIREIAPHMSAQQSEVRGALIVSQVVGLMIFISDAKPRHKELADLKKEASAAIMRIAFGK